jgi:YegS/Rv2252/BmrU family lipid kinase
MEQQKSKLFIIFNPIAGKGKALKALPAIERFLKEQNAGFEIIFTQRSGHALEIARSYAESSDEPGVVVAAGGDGTCNEVVNGLLTRKKGALPVFSILPIGRGNDFAYSARMPPEIERSLAVLLSGNTIPLDVGLVKGGIFPEGRYFVNGVGMGFDCKVGFEAAKMKHIHSALSYALGAIITVARFEPSPVVEIRYDDKTFTLPAAIVSVVNGRRMGGTFFMGPNAILNDGLLDFCTVHHTKTRMKLIDIVLHYPKGTQGECEGVTMGRGAVFRLRALEGGMAAHCDGETICTNGKELEIVCVPNALKLISPV